MFCTNRSLEQSKNRSDGMQCEAEVCDVYFWVHEQTSNEAMRPYERFLHAHAAHVAHTTHAAATAHAAAG